MRYEVIVIGAGMVGTSAAWHLQKITPKFYYWTENYRALRLHMAMPV